MKHLAEGVLKHRRWVLTIFLAAALICALLATTVSVNYNLTDYLPKDARSTVALEVMNREFDQATPNVRAYIPNVSIAQALQYKRELAALEGVEDVLWLDDVADIYQPLETLDPETVDAWYQDNGALYTITVDKTDVIHATEKIRSVIGDAGAMSGEAVNSADAQKSTLNEVGKIMAFVVPMILLILFLTTKSWFEPVLFLITIGISIVINEGTNVIFGEISFITQATSAILQLAVSMDYAIFLLNRFAKLRAEKMEIHEAMRQAMIHSSSAILASAMTTILGFLALAIMKFKIGPDMGIVLAKGIVFSLLSVLFFLPALAMATHKLIEKTHHRSFLPSFRKFGRFSVRMGIPIALVAAILVVPCFLAQQNNSFIYGAEGMNSDDSRLRTDEALLNEKFGQFTQMVLMVPRGSWGAEKELNEALKEIPHITSIVSYTNTVGQEIPVGFLPEGQISNFISENYSRIILTADTPDEGDIAFETVEQVRDTAFSYYRDDYHLAGGSVNTYDMMETVTNDNRLVNWAAILGIGFVLLLTFRSLTIPLILLFTIETSIWINLSIPFFLNTQLNYIGFLVISAVQLGATVDYAILLAQRYLENRRTLLKWDAACQTVTDTAASILTSAGILTLAGIMIGVNSTNGVVSELGIVLGRGAALSAVMVLFFLPVMMILLDSVIQKTTLRLRLRKKEKNQSVK